MPAQRRSGPEVGSRYRGGQTRSQHHPREDVGGCSEEDRGYKLPIPEETAHTPTKFNCSVEEAVSSARTKLTRLKPTVLEEREALKRAESSLDDGMKQLATCQKHIKIADRSEHGWATVDHYEDDPLASGPDNEKEIDRAESKAEKDAKKEADRGANKRSRGGGGQRRHQYRDQPYLNDHQWLCLLWRPERPVGASEAFQPRMLGPCFQCGAYGYIAKKKPSTLGQHGKDSA